MELAPAAHRKINPHHCHCFAVVSLGSKISRFRYPRAIHPTGFLSLRTRQVWLPCEIHLHPLRETKSAKVLHQCRTQYLDIPKHRDRFALLVILLCWTVTRFVKCFRGGHVVVGKTRLEPCFR